MKVIFNNVIQIAARV